MVNKEVLNYISGEMDKGTSREAIEKNLLSNGWDANDLKEAFALVSSVNSSSSSPVNANKISDMKEGVLKTEQTFPSVKTMPNEATDNNSINPVANSPSPNLSNKIPETKPLSGFTTMQSQLSQSPSPQMNSGETNLSQNFASVKTVTRETKTSGFMGYVWTALIFVLIGLGGGFYISNKFFGISEPVEEYTSSTPQPVLPPTKDVSEDPVSNEIATSTNDIICIQVVTKARDPKTKIVKEFGTPCDVPEGWEIISATSTDVSPLSNSTSSVPKR